MYVHMHFSFCYILVFSFSFPHSLIPSMQSLQSELSSLRSEVEGGRERVRELEIMVEDKEEQARIVEKKSNGLVRR